MPLKQCRNRAGENVVRTANNTPLINRKARINFLSVEKILSIFFNECVYTTSRTRVLQPS